MKFHYIDSETIKTTTADGIDVFVNYHDKTFKVFGGKVGTFEYEEEDEVKGIYVRFDKLYPMYAVIAEAQKQLRDILDDRAEQERWEDREAQRYYDWQQRELTHYRNSQL